MVNTTSQGYQVQSSALIESLIRRNFNEIFAYSWYERDMECWLSHDRNVQVFGISVLRVGIDVRAGGSCMECGNSGRMSQAYGFISRAGTLC